jgi:hypothetical protein
LCTLQPDWTAQCHARSWPSFPKEGRRINYRSELLDVASWSPTRLDRVPATRDWSRSSSLLCSVDCVPAFCSLPCRTSNSLTQITKQELCILPCFRYRHSHLTSFLGSRTEIPATKLGADWVQLLISSLPVMHDSDNSAAVWNWMRCKNTKERKRIEFAEITMRPQITLCLYESFISLTTIASPTLDLTLLTCLPATSEVPSSSRE